jgi:hypothetical protein
MRREDAGMDVVMSRDEVLMCWAFAKGRGDARMIGTFQGAFEFSLEGSAEITVFVSDTAYGVEVLAFLSELLEARSALRQITVEV